ncbi:MAG: AI-2E family transporter [Beutenbergiaceae bacterium]
MGAEPSLPDPPPTGTGSVRKRTIAFDTRSIWRAGWVVVSIAVLVLLALFFMNNAGSFFFVIVLAFFGAMALEPAVSRLAQRMPRPAATGLVLLALAIAAGIFIALFGAMLADQVASLIRAVPGVADSVIEWINTRFGTDYAVETILGDLGIDRSTITNTAAAVAGDVLSVVGGVVSSFLNVFALLFFLFYMSAGMPTLRTWIAGLVRPDHQVVFLTIWQTMLVKVGGYVAARLILAVVCGASNGLFMMAIGVPYWLPLAIWTGVIAQFVPTIGTYIAIALPVLVGLTSNDPMDGLWVLAFAIGYQQFENIGLEPRISSSAVNVHPAVSFGSALIGVQLFGLAGAMLAVPFVATMMAVFDIYKQRWEVTEATEDEAAELVRAGMHREVADVKVPDNSVLNKPVTALDDMAEPEPAPEAEAAPEAGTRPPDRS